MFIISSSIWWFDRGEIGLIGRNDSKLQKLMNCELGLRIVDKKTVRTHGYLPKSTVGLVFSWSRPQHQNLTVAHATCN